MVVEVVYELGEVAEAGVSGRAEHSHEALRLPAELSGESLEADRCVDVVARQGLADSAVFVAGRMGECKAACEQASVIRGGLLSD